MSYKLIKKFYKKNDESWEGIYIGDITKAISTKEPDPRDNNGYDDNQLQAFRTQLDVLNTQPGYLGFDRRYVSDNQLDIIRYFDTEESMKSYYNMIVSKQLERATSIDNVRETTKENSKFLGYMVRYEMQDNEGNILQRLDRNGKIIVQMETIPLTEKSDV